MYEFLFGALIVGPAIGAWGYRYYLKKNPEQLEAWAQKLKRLRDQAAAKARGE